MNRYAAVTLEGVAGINITGCTFTRLDNAGVFIGGYARGVVIADNEFAWLGESGVVSLGDTEGSPVPGWGVRRLVFRDFLLSHHIPVYSRSPRFTRVLFHTNTVTY